MNITIIATEFHKDISEEMVKAATEELSKLDVKNPKIVGVSGSFEMPLVAEEALSKKETDALVLLGYIEKGETLHGEVMGHVVHEKLLELGLKYKKPIGLGIIGPGATLEQAKARTEGTAKRAVLAVFKSFEALKGI